MITTGDRLCLKEFLSNNIDESGSIVWSLEVPTEGKYYDSSLSLKDCNRSITLDFGFSNHRELTERIEKVDLLIRCLEPFRDRLEECKRLVKITSRRGDHTCRHTL